MSTLTLIFVAASLVLSTASIALNILTIRGTRRLSRRGDKG